MTISISNLGIVQTANIDLNGLTVLTGHNDTGKSFIGKMLFSLIKTLQEYEQNYSNNQIGLVFQFMASIEQAHRTILPYNSHRQEKFRTMSARIRGFLVNALSEDPYIISDINNILEYKEEIKKDIEENKAEMENKNIAVPSFDSIENFFEGLILNVTERPTKEYMLKLYFDTKIIPNIFKGQINSLFNDGQLDVKLIQGSTILLSVSIVNNSTILFNCENEVFQTDATIIETPTILQLDSFVFRSLMRRGSSSFGGSFYSETLPFHYLDLLVKCSETGGSPMPLVSHPEILKEITQIIGGEVVFEDKVFNYHKNEKAIASTNIATGIKAFGVLQLLIRAGKINSSSFLIIDEPEVHLHPAWEIEYAKIIVLLSKAGVPLIISTHSSYILQALAKYIREYETQDISTFYFGEPSSPKDEGKLSKFKNVTHDLEPIFKALAEPMKEIYFN